MLPGTYTTGLHASFPTETPVKVIGTGANIVVVGDVAAVVVDGGAALDVRNLSSASERQVQCGLVGMNAPRSTVSLQAATLSMVGMGIAFETQNCELNLRNVDLTTHVDVVATRNDSIFRADGLFVHGSGAINTIIGAGSRVSIDVINSVLEDTDFVSFFTDNGPPGSTVRFAYNTFLLAKQQGYCFGNPAMYRSVTLENDIFVNKGAFDTFSTPNAANCTFFNTILTRQASAPEGTSVTDPMFVDAAAHDYHLTPGSPAVDAAGQATANPDHDLDGVARPQGAKPDIGAYERKQ